MKEKIIVIGGGGHARVIINAIKVKNEFDIAGYVDNVDKGDVLGIKYLGNDDVLEEVKNRYKNCNAVIGIGNVTLSYHRQDIYKVLKRIGFGLPVIISSNAIIGDDVHIAEGTVVLDGSVINCGSRIGTCAIINTSTIIEHDCTVGDFVHVTPCSILNNGAFIGANTFIGTGAVIEHNINITADCLIGAGSVVIRDITESGKYWGIPAGKVV